MLALHYEITLPVDYDMGIIRARVATRGHALDDYAGLRFKAYLIREVGVNGSPVNQYAPFYLWDDTDAMGKFLWGGDGFGGIVRDFGRPVGQTWVGIGVGAGPDAHAIPRAATKLTTLLGKFADPQEVVEASRAALSAQLLRPGVHSSVAAIDPRTWETVQFTLWSEPHPKEAGEHFEVLHLSAPTGV
jgi:hypothetical protein